MQLAVLTDKEMRVGREANEEMKKYVERTPTHTNIRRVRKQSPDTPCRELDDKTWLDNTGKNLGANPEWPEHQGYEVRRDGTVEGEVGYMTPGMVLDRFGGFYAPRVGFICTILKKLGHDPSRCGGAKKKLWHRAYKKRDLGFFFSEPNVPLEARSMRPLQRPTIYTTYVVVKPFVAVKGHAAAYFGMPGGAPQTLAFREVEELIKGGFIKKIHQELRQP